MNIKDFLFQNMVEDIKKCNFTKEELLFYFNFGYFNKNEFKFWKENGNLPKSKKDLELVLKRESFEANKIKEYKGKALKKFIFRPRNLNEYIGQEKAKEIVKVNIEKIKKIRPVHILIDGLKGHGKTTLVHIISSMLEAEFYQTIASDINMYKLIEIINWINSTPENKLPVVFLDEIHGLPADIIEVFYPIMEDYFIYGKRIKPFVLIGATTEKNVLVKNFSPFVDRFQVKITLERYTEKDIFKILQQYHSQMYKGFKVKEEDLLTIAKNCKFIPRIAIALLEDLIIVNDIKKVLNMHDIIKDALTKKDIKILEILYENKKPLGGETMSMMLGISQADYKYLYESYLIEMGYIGRGKTGRILLEKGKKLVESLKGGSSDGKRN